MSQRRRPWRRNGRCRKRHHPSPARPPPMLGTPQGRRPATPPTGPRPAPSGRRPPRAIPPSTAAHAPLVGRAPSRQRRNPTAVRAIPPPPCGRQPHANFRHPTAHRRSPATPSPRSAPAAPSPFRRFKRRAEDPRKPPEAHGVAAMPTAGRRRGRVRLGLQQEHLADLAGAERRPLRERPPERRAVVGLRLGNGWVPAGQ